MKNIFKIKRHPHRSNEPSPSSAAGPVPPALAQSPTEIAPSCASDHRAASSSSAVTTAPSPTSASTLDSTTPAVVAADKGDYFSSEEEFQVQLALAISASNSEFRDDPDGYQIRAAKLLSLGRQPADKIREEGTAESLSRRYWDYNVLDYGEKVVDGFYDIFRPAANSADQGKMPSLSDLQTGIGDLGFEVIVVNRTIDPALVELEQIAQCMSLGCPSSDIGFLVQRISELVMEHMGGPVRDANEMLARWMEKSTELRTLQQTSLLPIGCIKVGLSRHRALLFKVLADNVGIPCRLVKGSHYTGVDDDAVNILKLNDEREYLVDLMAAPGTLIPADVPSIKESAAKFHNPKVRKNLISLETSNAEGVFRDNAVYNGHIGGYETSTLNVKTALGKGTSILSSHNDYNNTSAIAGSSSGGDSSSSMQEQPIQVILPIPGTSSKQKEVIDVSLVSDNNRKGKLNQELLGDVSDSRNLFAELNPFQEIGADKPYPQYKASDARNVEYQRRRENIAVGVGRSQNPLVWKGRSACNEDPNTNQNNFMDGLLPRKNLGEFNASSSQIPCLDGKPPSRIPNNVGETFFSGQSSLLGSSESNTSGLPLTAGYSSSGKNQSNIMLGEKNTALEIGHDSKADVLHLPFQSSNYSILQKNVPNMPVLQKNVPNIPENNGQNLRKKHERKKDLHDQLLCGPNGAESSCKQVNPSRIDTILDDVAAWEIPWEDLVIGERIGLGSYGEVYRADWNGTEVAVKKFLDQDFYGDALDEFRSEVRIMRRLRHPNIVLFMGAVTRPPNLSIVSEFLPRGSLYKILHRPNCQIDEKLRIKMALDVAKGMNCLHISVPTIVHRDLKSPNLLVDKNWTVKVCDFGLSRLKHSTFLSSKSTAGTPEWMAPEVLRNELSNEKCDVYSFGVILWELATLRMPWSGMNPMQVVGAVGFQERRLEIPKEVDPLVANIIRECWQTDPNLRPSFAQLTTALKSLHRLVNSTHQETQSPLVSHEISVNSTTQ